MINWRDQLAVGLIIGFVGIVLASTTGPLLELCIGLVVLFIALFAIVIDMLTR